MCCSKDHGYLIKRFSMIVEIIHMNLRDEHQYKLVPTTENDMTIVDNNSNHSMDNSSNRVMLCSTKEFLRERKKKVYVWP